MVSVLTVTYNREALTRRCLGLTLERAGFPFQLMSVDNGSTDGVADYISSLKPTFHMHNPANLGYAHALNQMMINTDSEYVCILDPDLEMSDGWLHRLVSTNQKIPHAGLSSIHCVQDLPSPVETCGVVIYPRTEVFGAKFLSRKLIDKVGYFYEGFGLYGIEDNEYNLRCNVAGLLNYYVSGVFCEHAGEDTSDTSEYRKFKWDALDKAGKLWEARRKYIVETGDYYLPAPEEYVSQQAS